MNGFTAEFYHLLKELTPMLFKLFYKTERDETLANSSCRQLLITLLLKLHKNTTNIYKPFSSMIINAEILHEILASQIQQH
jgi:hypothetical protein